MDGRFSNKMADAPNVEEISADSLSESANDFDSKEEESVEINRPGDEGVSADTPPVEFIEARALQRWPLETNEIYSLSSDSKRRVLDILQQRLSTEKNQRRESTELLNYHQPTHELDIVESRLFSQRIQRLKSKYKAVFRKTLHRRVLGEEPNYIRIFKFYVDSLSAGVRPARNLTKHDA
jgi:hypothetical protein